MMEDITEKFEMSRLVISHLYGIKAEKQREVIEERNQILEHFIESVVKASGLSDGTWDWSETLFMIFLRAKFKTLETKFIAAQTR
jgi:hypothetical protein